MGNKIGKQPVAALKDKDVKRFRESTGFEAEEVRLLFGVFLGLKADDALPQQRLDEIAVSIT